MPRQTDAADILEMGRRWQRAWTSHLPNANNAVGDSFGQLTDEIERLRGAVIVLSVGLRDICEPITAAADSETLGALQDLHELISDRAKKALVDAGLTL